MLCHPEPGSAVSYALRNAKSLLPAFPPYSGPARLLSNLHSPETECARVPVRAGKFVLLSPCRPVNCLARETLARRERPIHTRPECTPSIRQGMMGRHRDARYRDGVPLTVTGGRCWRMRSAATVVMHGQAPAHLAGVLAWRRLVSARCRRFTASSVLREKHPAALSGPLGMQPRRARSTLPPSIRRNRRTKGRKAWDDPSQTVQMLRCGSGCCNDR